MDPIHEKTILDSGTPVMLTLSPDNTHQFLRSTMCGRLNLFKEFYRKILSSVFDLFTTYEGSLEISEALASDGHHFPRLHYHIVGVIRCPIKYLLMMGVLKNKGTGYHTTIIKSPDDYTKYQSYIKKQRKLWERSGLQIDYQFESKK